MPYLYSEYMKAILEDKMYFRPIGFDYEEDEMAWQVEDQLMVGESMMIAPIYTQNAKGRYVYLPSDMLMLRIRSMEDMRTIFVNHYSIFVSVVIAVTTDMVFFVDY